MKVLQTHHLLVSLRIAIPPALLHRVDGSHVSHWMIWVQQFTMPAYVPNVDQTNNSLKWNGVEYRIHAGRGNGQDIAWQLGSVGLTTKWSYVDQRFVFQTTGTLDLTAADSIADLLGLEHAVHQFITPGNMSTKAPDLHFLDYVLVNCSLAMHTHIWNEGTFTPNTPVLCMLPVNVANNSPAVFEDSDGCGAIYYTTNVLDAFWNAITDTAFNTVPSLLTPWKARIVIKEVITDDLPKNIARLLSKEIHGKEGSKAALQEEQNH
jgi:hypothetical protein